MNFYNPYFYTMPNNFVGAAQSGGLLSRIFGGAGTTLGGFLNGTQKVLNFANQAIPLVKQVKPMIGNAKTMFKVMNEFKRVENKSTQKTLDNSKNNNTNNNIKNDNTNVISDQTKNTNNNFSTNNNGPTFFI